MAGIKKVEGAAAPLMQANVDTDVIIRIERLTSGMPLGDFALEALRYLPDGTKNPDCILNEKRFSGAPILIAGKNFGCGSSREGAVTALMEMGVRCIIAPSFGDIFFGNCFQNGLLPIVTSEENVEHLAIQAEVGELCVDLERCSIESPEGKKIKFEIDPLQQEALLEGLDELGQTLKWLGEIQKWQQQDRVTRPWVWLSLMEKGMRT
ncbi:MAG: 3-isopropylmalate dehydratase small subunit [Parvibaculaceae bacterium]|nr:3-isopropylmalate dehydratase small subunit [Parvibaculaceae bacterium]